MNNMNRLRRLIALSWVIYICQVIVVHYYDVSLDSSLIHQSSMSLNKAVDLNNMFDIMLLIEVVLLIYSSAGLWMGHITGRIAFVLYVIFTIADNFFVPIRVFSSVDLLLEDLSFLVLGMILFAIYAPPLNQRFAQRELTNFWVFFLMFFVFFAIFFGTPLLAIYMPHIIK